jgi:peptide/nickel transport system substrate-binding protein
MGDEHCFAPATDGTCKFLLFSNLAQPNAEGQLEGRLARGWEHTPDYRTWTIHLRTDVRWHDGVPFTAHDVKFTYDLWKHPDVLSENGYGVESVTVLDDSTYTITHTQLPQWDRYWYPGVWATFYPKHLLGHLDPANINDWEFWSHPVGNGPFRHVRTVPKTGMVFEANPDYFRGKPKIDEVVLRFGSYSLTELFAGEVDALNLDRKEDVGILRDDPRFRIYYEIWDDTAAVFALFWNSRHPPLSDVRVRRALTLATDRATLQQILFRDPDLPVVDAPYTVDQYWRGDLPEAHPFDPVEAVRLLEEAGWVDTDGDGVRDKDGQALAFTCLVWEEWRRGAVWLQSQYARIGVDMEILQMDPPVVRERVRAGDYEAVITYAFMQMFDYTSGLFGEGTSFGDANPDAVRLIHRAQELTVPDEIDAVYREMQPIFLREVPYTALTLGVETFVAHRRVKGLSTPFRGRPTWYAEDLWIEEEEDSTSASGSEGGGR